MTTATATTVATTVAATAAMGVIDPVLAAVLVPFVVAVGTVPFWLRRRAGAQGQRLRDELGTLSAEVVDGVQGLRELVVFGQGPAYARSLARSRSVARHQLTYGRRAGAELAAGDGLQALGMLAILATAGALVIGGSVSRSLYPLVTLLAVYALAPLAAVSQTARELGQIRACARRVFTVIEHPAAVSDPTGPAEAGETVALVGHSGAGKSTCANLLLRFWDPDSGAVSLGGVNLRDWPAEGVRDRVALVPQEVYLFNSSLRDDIRLGRPNATDSEIHAAARQANIHDFIVGELAEGYDTICGERGAELSGGQRQRIAIARALLKDTPVLVMDEAVSNLDAENEQAVQDAMAHVAHGRTALLIAHRLSTIRSADRIVVLAAGQVTETGTHDELIDANGAYTKLIAGQHGGLVGM